MQTRCVPALLCAGLALAVTRPGGGADMKPEETEVWKPVPPVVRPGDTPAAAPADAIVLFDGGSLARWRAAKGGPATWQLDGGAMTVKPGAGDIVTTDAFGSVQLHVEWRVPAKVDGEGQDRGNSGVYLQSRYELQVMDSYQNPTYVNGMAASLYKQAAPLVNAARKPGEWQSYDVIYRAPRFNARGTLTSPARFTVFWNGLLVQDHTALKGPTLYIGHPHYEAHGKAPLLLQDHWSPVSYRNIWVRRLQD